MNLQDRIDDYLAGNKQFIKELEDEIELLRFKPEEEPDDFGVLFEGMTISRWLPWLGDCNNYKTALSKEKLYNIKQFSSLCPADGVVYECGVYTGGTTRMLLDLGWDVVAFDTFKGIRGSDENDIFEDGAYDGGEVFDYIHPAQIEQGVLPFQIKNRWHRLGYEDKISFAHIDLDVYKPTLDCLELIYDRVIEGGIIVVDDYGIWPTPGVKKAVDEFNPPKSFYLPTGQMVIMK